LALVLGVTAAIGLAPYLGALDPREPAPASPVAWLGFLGPTLVVVMATRLSGGLSAEAGDAYAAVLMGLGIFNLGLGAVGGWRSNPGADLWRYSFLGDWGLVGGYAEYVAVEDDNVALVPEGVALAEASIAACAIGTLLNAVRDVGKLKMGESALVTGAGGGLGLHAIQLARLAGAFVIAQTTSPDKAELIRKMGAHEVVLHARGEDFSGEVKRLTGGRGVDVLLDNVGTPLFEPMRRSLGVAGRWILIGQLSGQFIQFNPAQLFLKNQSMLAVTSTSRNQLEDVLQLMSRGQVRAVVTRELSLEQAGEAHGAVEAGRATGRILSHRERGEVQSSA